MTLMSKPLRRKAKVRVVANVSSSSYPIVKRCFKENGCKLTKDADNWDMFWSDNEEVLKRNCRLNEFQVVNHFPGMAAICRKDFLGNNLELMRRELGSLYSFSPRTWMLPRDYAALRRYMAGEDEAGLSEASAKASTAASMGGNRQGSASRAGVSSRLLAAPGIDVTCVDKQDQSILIAACAHVMKSLRQLGSEDTTHGLVQLLASRQVTDRVLEQTISFLGQFWLSNMQVIEMEVSGQCLNPQ